MKRHGIRGTKRSARQWARPKSRNPLAGMTPAPTHHYPPYVITQGVVFRSGGTYTLTLNANPLGEMNPDRRWGTIRKAAE